MARKMDPLNAGVGLIDSELNKAVKQKSTTTCSESPCSDPHSLWELKESEAGFVCQFDQALENEFQIRLREIGFEKTQPVACLKKSLFGGPAVFQIGGSVFSLAKEVATQVMIHPQKTHQTNPKKSS